MDLGAGRTAVAVAAGGRQEVRAHTCARLDDGSVRCWGVAFPGRLGYCNATDIGDDETPAAAGPVELGVAGSPGAGCPVPPPPPPQPTPNPTPPRPAAPNPVDKGPSDALARQARRARSLRKCLRGDKRRAGRTLRRRCLRRHGRTPGRVTRLRARATGRRRVELRFRAPGSDGAKPPAARTYLIKQARRPIRSARAFRRARPLCKRVCRFDVAALPARITLSVTKLKRRETYYYAVAARDNVSGRIGRRSKTIRVRTR